MFYVYGEHLIPIIALSKLTTGLYAIHVSGEPLTRDGETHAMPIEASRHEIVRQKLH